MNEFKEMQVSTSFFYAKKRLLLFIFQFLICNSIVLLLVLFLRKLEVLRGSEFIILLLAILSFVMPFVLNYLFRGKYILKGLAVLTNEGISCVSDYKNLFIAWKEVCSR